EGVALFEIARVYLPDGGELPREEQHVAGIVEGGFPRAKGAVETILGSVQLQGSYRRGSHDLLHPGKTAVTDHGVVGELRPGILEGSWGAFELDLGSIELSDHLRYEDLITFPPIKQDLAFSVPDDVLVGDLAEAAHAAVPELRKMVPFDVYRGEQVGDGRKSIAFRVEFRSPERTLTDEEAAAQRDKIVNVLKLEFGAELRS
nr:hypothetical protein [Actinomycetota bacterium]